MTGSLKAAISEIEVEKRIDFTISEDTHYPRRDQHIIESPEGVRLCPTYWNKNFHPEQLAQTYPTIEALLDALYPGRVEWWEEHKDLTARQESAVIKAALQARGFTAKVRHYLGGIVVEIGRDFTADEKDEIYRTIQLATGKGVGVHVFSQFKGKLAAGYRRGSL